MHNENMEEIKSISTVSYTHLDVYKRQLPFWQTGVGGTMEVGGQLIEGAQNIFFAQLADPSVTKFAVSATRFMSCKFPLMIFGLPGACLLFTSLLNIVQNYAKNILSFLLKTVLMKKIGKDGRNLQTDLVTRFS